MYSVTDLIPRDLLRERVFTPRKQKQEIQFDWHESLAAAQKILAGKSCN